MRKLVLAAQAATIAGAALALAACSGSSATNNTTANDLGTNMTFEEPANDASAMEAAGNATETPAPAANDSAADNNADPGAGESGANVDSNVSGM
jgi:hypothetical protein